jgi:hypothetical protein
MAAIRPVYADAGAERVNDLGIADEASVREQLLEFHAVAGVRLERMLRMLSKDSNLQLGMRIVMVVTEVCRPISYFFQVAAEGRLRCNRPVLCDLSKPWTSPVVACEQYLTALMLGSAPAARLVWQREGHASFAAWAQAKPQDPLLCYCSKVCYDCV